MGYLRCPRGALLLLIGLRCHPTHALTGVPVARPLRAPSPRCCDQEDDALAASLRRRRAALEQESLQQERESLEAERRAVEEQRRAFEQQREGLQQPPPDAAAAQPRPPPDAAVTPTESGGFRFESPPPAAGAESGGFRFETKPPDADPEQEKLVRAATLYGGRALTAITFASLAFYLYVGLSGGITDGFDRYPMEIEDIRVTMEREGGDRFIGEPPGAQALGGYEPSGPP